MTNRFIVFLALMILLDYPISHSQEATPATSRPGLSLEEAKAVQTEAARKPGTPKELSYYLGEGISLDVVLIPAGEFLMGSYLSHTETAERYGGLGRAFELEHPQHPVRLTKPFYISKFEITQKQWTAVMGDNPSPIQGDSLPVYKLTWEQCVDFCKKLSDWFQREVRMPTEAEWEYTCRATTTTPFYFGETLERTQANFDSESPIAVGSYPPNVWGVYDMHGNIREWVNDFYGGYVDSLQVDPMGPPDHIGAMIRGGAYDSQDGVCRSSWRYSHHRGLNDQNAGFRITLLPVN